MPKFFEQGGAGTAIGGGLAGMLLMQALSGQGGLAGLFGGGTAEAATTPPTDGAVGMTDIGSAMPWLNQPAGAPAKTATTKSPAKTATPAAEGKENEQAALNEALKLFIASSEEAKTPTAEAIKAPTASYIPPVPNPAPLGLQIQNPLAPAGGEQDKLNQALKMFLASKGGKSQFGALGNPMTQRMLTGM